MAKPRPCPDACNVLLIGGGGREHALAWKMSQSTRLGRLWVTHPENGGLAALGRPCPHPWDVSNAFRLKRWCEEEAIDLVVVGPEMPLAEGIADALATERCFVFGPTRDGARIEADKAYAKTLMRQAAIPTAEARAFDDPDEACRYVLRGMDGELRRNGDDGLADALETYLQRDTVREDEQPVVLPAAVVERCARRRDPVVVKASGLAAGKGVVVCDTTGEALAAIERIMVELAFGDAGSTVIIEERLTGQEISVLALVDGRSIWILDPCQDHKPVGEGDTGPNTGGMGAYCPTPLVDEDTLARIEQEILVLVVDALRRDGVTYRGVLYAGLMLTAGGPKVLEFNCRFGDPECQPLMMRLRGDLVELLWATCTGTLDEIALSFDPHPACCVVMCARGYPGSYEKGVAIEGIAEAEALGDVTVFHAGTTADGEGRLKSSGGRVLGVTALGDSLAEARDLANTTCERISFEGAFWRHDIGDRVLGPSGVATG